MFMGYIIVDYRKKKQKNGSYGYDSRRIEFKWFVILKYLQYKIEYYIEYILYYNIYFK